MGDNLLEDMARANLLVLKRGLDRRLAEQIGQCGGEVREAILGSLEVASAAQIRALNELATLRRRTPGWRASAWVLLADAYSALEDARQTLRKLVRANSRQRAK